MSSGPYSFTETEVKRAIRSVEKAGKTVAGVEINPRTGSILVHVGKPANDNAAGPDSDWDKALAREGN
jgi:cell division protein FtsI/penicillin-binding protein 2